MPPTAALAAQQLPGPCLWLVHASSRLSGPGVLEMHLSICQTVQQGAACHMHPHRCPCCCNSPLHACAGVPHLHGHLSQHEHSLLLQRPGVHGVFCVPPDLVRPARPGTVPLLQDHALCRAGGWVGGWEGHCCGCGNLKPPLRRHVLQASHQSAVACMAVRAGTTPILDQPHCAAVLCSTTVPWHQAERATSKRAGGGGGLEASQAAAQGAAGEQYSRKSTLVGSQHENAHGCSQSWCHTHGDTPGCVVHSCIADTVQHPQALCVLGAAFPPNRQQGPLPCWRLPPHTRCMCLACVQAGGGASASSPVLSLLSLCPPTPCRTCRWPQTLLARPVQLPTMQQQMPAPTVPRTRCSSRQARSSSCSGITGTAGWTSCLPTQTATTTTAAAAGVWRS